MEIKRPGNVFPVCGMLCAAGILLLLAARGAPERPGVRPCLRLPREVGGWERVRNVRFNEQVLRILGTGEAAGAVYRNGSSDTVYLVLVCATNNRAAFHPPEYCMEGSGYEMCERRRVPAAAGLEANELLFTRGPGEDILVWNWYASGTELTGSFYRQQAALLAGQIRDGRSRGSAVTLYTRLAGGDPERGRRANADFARSFVPYVRAGL